MKISGDEVASPLGPVSDGQIGGGSKNDVSPQEEVGDRYAMDGQIKQGSLHSDKHFLDLDEYLGHCRAKSRTTFLELLDDKQAINF